MSIRCTYKIESCFETFEHQNPFECAMTTGSQILIDQLNASELADYEQFCIEKSSRKHVDIYTAFLPFNEATRALHALFPTMKELRPKQILVLWDRSCYLSRLMEAMFPEAKIYTTWEGDHDVLGKKGFAYWTRSEAPSTPKVTFCNHEKSMPCFEDSSFDLILGMDLLHRIQLGPFFNEIDRLLKPMGGAVFPHVHLSNAQPDPFFERGGVYRSGNDYQDF